MVGQVKTVAVIGAGPAGLTAAKTLLETGHFKVKVYEKKSRIGGIWALSEDTVDGLLPPDTPVNLSRFTVGFSDLDWNDVDLTLKKENHAETSQNRENRGVPLFPKAWQVNRYLEEYRARYLSSGEGEPDIVNLDCEITNVQRDSTQSSGSAGWRLTFRDASGNLSADRFDFLIIASGFFSQPRNLFGKIPPADVHAANGTGLGISIMHSSEFRNLHQLLGAKQTIAGKKILVIGGGNSSGEVAANIAFQLSDSQWSPGSARHRDIFKGAKIIHVTPRPLYALPPFVPLDADSTSFVPLDFKLYDLSRRPAGPILSNAGELQPEVKNILHGFIQGMIGGDQSDLSDALVSSQQEGRSAPYVALSEGYAEYVRTGLIEVINGRVEDLQTTDDTVKAIASGGGGKFEIEDVAAVVHANGYTPSSALQFLSEDVKSLLEFDSSSMRLPLLLENWQTSHPSINDLSLLGFYEGPYWGVMEMQARLTARKWLDTFATGPEPLVVERRPFEQNETLRKLRSSMQSRGLDVPQYWFGDYLAYMEEIATALKLDRNDGKFNAREGPVSPARYLTPSSGKLQAVNIMTDLSSTWFASQKGKYMARASLRSMQGSWEIERTIKSKNSVLPSGVLKGSAFFHPRVPTLDKSKKSFDLEYLYVETGIFTTDAGFSMNATRRYVYRYSEALDQMSIWFVKPSNDLEVDYLFHNLTFSPSKEAKNNRMLVAKAEHLCIDDTYWTTYRLPIKGVALPNFEIEHTVKGPRKDYVAVTRYNRSRR